MKVRIIVLATATLVLLGAAGPATGKPKTFKLRAELTAAQEVPAPTGVPANARGTFTATVNLPKGTITWHLTYSGLSGPNFGTHVHFGKGGVANLTPAIDLCGTQLSRSGIRCKSGIRKTFDKNSPQLSPEELAKLARAPAYVQIHTGKNTTGEIRGQLRIVR